MKPGTHVQVTTTNNTVFEGLVLPADHLVLKLSDGYNLGFDERNVKEVKELSEKKKSKKKEVVVEKDDSLPLIRILHTGGTIASKVDYATGGTSNLIEPEELLAQYPELQEFAHVEASFVANMSSDDMRFAHYNVLINHIVTVLNNEHPKGIIITQGTDTMHYTAAALHYALQHIPIPVVIVGSQRSSDRGSSDAATNLLGAARFIVTLGLPGVYIAMHAGLDDNKIAILQGVNARKMHSSRRDAFKPINRGYVAFVMGDEVMLVADKPLLKGTFEPVMYKENLRIGMAYMHPQYSAEELLGFKGFDGLIILGTGLGHSPINTTDDYTIVHAAVKKAMEELTESMPVVMTTQCMYGRVNMHVYSAGRRHLDLGFLGDQVGLTPEASFIKLAYCLSAGLSPEKISYDFGDLVLRTEEEGYE